jgi:hypothetical protein
MISKWFKSKSLSIRLRKKGKSIKYINKKLGIPLSTLSGWFKDIKLTSKQKEKLERDREIGLIKARKKAKIWHNNEKQKRLKLAKKEAHKLISKINFSDERNLEIALAFLYLGEGFKNYSTAMGNSDPRILKFFISILRNNYQLKIENIKCELHLRADQDEKTIKGYWSKELKIPQKNFTKTSFDKRTNGSVTYSYYKGVCVVRCANVAIQRKLLYFSNAFCDKVIKMAERNKGG